MGVGGGKRMKADLTKYGEQVFEDIKHVNENGQEYWLARELQPVLEYAQWRYLKEAIDRAKEACKNSGGLFCEKNSI